MTVDQEFGPYWYQGKAELSNYDLEQIRYGESRKGRSVMIFVTEDFSKKKQVKLDYPPEDPGDVVKVMKLNKTRKFFTGIYPYSTMMSVFSPIDPVMNSHAIKLSTSTQEWCGHTYLQANQVKKGYKISGKSYFESEGDEEYEIVESWLEDEVWNLIRLQPKSIPEGGLMMVPGSVYCRFKHVEFRPVKASISKEVRVDSTIELRIEYPDLDRTLTILYENTFPFKILGWEEEYPENGSRMATTARLSKSILLDYWNKNGADDDLLRKELGI